MSFTEANYENAIVQLMERLGYVHCYGPDVERDYQEPLYLPEVKKALRVLNADLPEDALSEALHKLRHIEAGKLEQKNAVFTDYLQNGVEVSYRQDGQLKYGRAYLIDYENVENNSFIVANQWTFVEHAEKRPDVVLFVNGFPLVVVELKSPSREETDASEAYRQLRNYIQDIPSFFVPNAFCVMSDMAETKAGTITCSERRFAAWKTTDGSYESTQFADYHVFFEGMFEKARFLDILKNFICFSKDQGKDAKILAAYHQYFAVKKAVASTLQATRTDGRGGVFWHTTGSGKSLSMVFYAKQLQLVLDSPTLVVITDRNDLDDQLFGQFSKCADFLRQTPVQAESREHLRELLEGRQANGIIFTTMQKFEDSDEPLSERRNVIVIADEAHRGHYGKEVFDAKTGKLKTGTSVLIHRNLPKATFIGFTGTPIAQTDKDTREVFGNYIDVYDMTQAVKDGATRPVYYESRVVRLNLDKEVLDRIDKEYEAMAEDAEPYAIEKSKKQLSQMETILGAQQTIDTLCDDIVRHYEENREQLLTGKAMIVAYSREIAVKIYRRILALRPDWGEKIAVVMTGSNNDPEDWKKLVGTKADKDRLARDFKDDNSPLKIAIVVDMWLTGFDVPSLATMYVYKPMEGHTLMQAIARVNRVFADKEGGLVVDYVGIASALRKAMRDYTADDKQNYGDPDIATVALPKFLEKLEVCRNLLHKYDYAAFKTVDDYERARIIMGGVNFLADPQEPERKAHFIKEAMLLRQALSLCRSMVREDDRLEAAFFEAVRTLATRITGTGQKLSLREINERVNELLKQAIKSEGVINLFSDIKEEFSLFDPKFLAEIARMEHKNLAAELLKKLIEEQVSAYRKTSIVKAEDFSARLQKTMREYLNGLLTNGDVIQKLIALAHEIIAGQKAQDALGLTKEEAGFYDALTKPQAVKDFYSNDQLAAIARELTDILRKNCTIDWQKKESAKAKMRMMVKRLLKKYKYPPEGQEEALNTVIAQCESWTDNADMP